MTGDPQDPPADDAPAAEPFVGVCRVCGCTESTACAGSGGCGWINMAGDVCSACVHEGIPDVVQTLHGVVEGAMMATDNQLRQGDEAGAMRSQAMAGIFMGAAELIVRCAAEVTMSDRRALAVVEHTAPEGYDDDKAVVAAHDALVDDLVTFGEKFGELGIMGRAPVASSGLVDARGREISSLGGLAAPGRHEGDTPGRAR